MSDTIWILSEGSPGHISQSVGLVRALSERLDIEHHQFETRPAFRGVARTFIRAWMGPRGRRLPDWFLRKCLGCDFEYDRPPNLIVTSGGKAVFAAKSLAVATSAPLVFIGERKPYPSEWFDLVLTPSPFEVGVNDLRIDLIPTGVDRQGADAAAANWTMKPEGRLWCMLIGGSSASHRYTPRDWKLLGEWMNRTAQDHGIRWLVTTSRRTGVEAEAHLRNSLEDQWVAQAVWWAEKPQKLMLPFLGSAERVFATQDSVTMVSEAVGSGRPVSVVYPEALQLSDQSFLKVYFNGLEAKGFILRYSTAELPEFGQVPTLQPIREIPLFDDEVLGRIETLIRQT